MTEINIILLIATVSMIFGSGIGYLITAKKSGKRNGQESKLEKTLENVEADLKKALERLGAVELEQTKYRTQSLELHEFVDRTMKRISARYGKAEAKLEKAEQMQQLLSESAEIDGSAQTEINYPGGGRQIPRIIRNGR